MKEMIDKIYEVIADKTLREGSDTDQGLYVGDRLDIITYSRTIGYRDIDEGCGCCSSPHYYETLTGIKNPVMIGDVLDWIDHNCNRIENGDGNKSRNIDRHRDLILQIYYYFINGLNKPIEDQPEDCILFIYNLIEGQEKKN